MTNAQKLAHHIVTLPVEFLRDIKAKVDACGDNVDAWEQVRTSGQWDLFQIKEVMAIWENANGPIA